MDDFYYTAPPTLMRRKSSYASTSSHLSEHSQNSHSSTSSFVRRERQNALTVQQSEELATHVLFVERRNSEEAQALQAIENERDAMETIYERVTRLEEENRLLRLKISELVQLGRG